MNFSIFFRVLPLFFMAGSAFALDYVKFEYRGKEREEAGRIVMRASDGIAFQARDGQFYVIAPDKMLAKPQQDDKEFKPYTKNEVLARLKKEFPESGGWKIFEKDRFIIVYTTSKAFAQWYAQLLEKLADGYISYWKGTQRKVPLERPKFPLVAVVLANFEEFRRFAGIEGFTMMQGQCAYYNKATNRIVLCDLSGLEANRKDDKKRVSHQEMQVFLDKPNAAFNIASAVHEAAHCIGFNCGMHPRFGPVPLWLCEGLAVFHEVPDKNSKSGWSASIKVNDNRLGDLRKYLNKNPDEPIQKMLQNDKVFQEADTALDNYAMAWGLTYYLVNKRPKDFAAYLEIIRQKKVTSPDSPEIRIQDFEKCFGNDWKQFYKDCGAYLKKL
jgi:hypothetical protein